MRTRSTRPRRAPWAAVARLGHAHWFFGNLYEAAVDMPRLLADAQPRRPPRILGRGSPLRYYAPAAPLTFAATAATCVDSWRSGGDRRAVIAVAASTASAVTLTAYLVGTVNLRLLRSREPVDATERRELCATWHRVNAARLLALGVASAALRQAIRSGG